MKNKCSKAEVNRKCDKWLCLYVVDSDALVSPAVVPFISFIHQQECDLLAAKTFVMWIVPVLCCVCPTEKSPEYRAGVEMRKWWDGTWIINCHHFSYKELQTAPTQLSCWVYCVWPWKALFLEDWFLLYEFPYHPIDTWPHLRALTRRWPYCALPCRASNQQRLHFHHCRHFV